LLQAWTFPRDPQREEAASLAALAGECLQQGALRRHLIVGGRFGRNGPADPRRHQPDIAGIGLEQQRIFETSGPLSSNIRKSVATGGMRMLEPDH
jgi:hypothetical protein